MQTDVDFSIVIPVYYNEDTVASTAHALNEQVFKNNPLRGEVVFVDDGSGDASLKELLALQQQAPDRVRIITLTRNFGQVAALHAGFRHARGKCVIAMSADGQDPASLITEMIRAHQQEKADIVICERSGRDESYYRILTSRIFYSIMRKLSFTAMPEGGFDFFLLSRRALDQLLRNREAHPFLQGQILWLGFKTTFIKYRRQQRTAGESRWTFGKKLTYLLDGVLSYSFFPIRFMSFTGLLMACAGFLYALVILIFKLIGGIPIEGWAPIMIVILIMGGFQMLMTGIIGEYVWRTLAQVRNRDEFIIDAIIDETGQGKTPNEPIGDGMTGREKERDT